MVQAIREIVTVGADGIIHVQSPELREGSQAEVIVLVDAGASNRAPNPLDALDALQNAFQLNPSQAREWADRNDAERKASSRL